MQSDTGKQANRETGQTSANLAGLVSSLHSEGETMKAYMSTETRWEFELPSELTLMAENAEREARAILNTVEPDACGDYQRLTWLGDWSEDVAALLAAFVEG